MQESVIQTPYHLGVFVTWECSSVPEVVRKWMGCVTEIRSLLSFSERIEAR